MQCVENAKRRLGNSTNAILYGLWVHYIRPTGAVSSSRLATRLAM